MVTSATGNYSGTRLLHVVDYMLQDNQFYLGIRKEGAWSIVIEQLQDRAGRPIPITLSGTGDNVVGPIELPPGLVMFTLACPDPNSYFNAALYNETGMVQPLSETYGTNEGTRLLGVGGQGGWNPDVGS